MTDREIIDIIKSDIVRGETADFLTLDVVDFTEDKKIYFSEEYWDDMFKTLFDYSLTKNIVVVKSRRLGIDELASRSSSKKSYNGSQFPIIGYTFGLQDSENHDTNITPQLMKFIEVAFTRAGLDKLAFPMRRNRIEYEFRGYSCENPIIYIPPEDPWEILEKYLKS